MIVAQHLDGTRTVASPQLRRATDDVDTVICPHCQQPVHARLGGRRLPHFAHFPGTAGNCRPGKGKARARKARVSDVEQLSFDPAALVVDPETA